MSGAVDIVLHRTAVELADSSGASIAKVRSQFFDGGAARFSLEDAVLRAGARGGLSGSVDIMNLAVGSPSVDSFSTSKVCVDVRRVTVRLPRLASFVVVGGNTRPQCLLLSVVDSVIEGGATVAERPATARFFVLGGAVGLVNSSVLIDNSTIHVLTAGARRRAEVLVADTFAHCTIAVVRGSLVKASSWGFEPCRLLTGLSGVFESTIVVLNSTLELYGGRGTPRLMHFDVATRSDIAVIGSRLFMASVEGHAVGVGQTTSSSTLSVTSSLIEVTGHDVAPSMTFIFGALSSSHRRHECHIPRFAPPGRPGERGASVPRWARRRRVLRHHRLGGRHRVSDEQRDVQLREH
jgi:hypothetical protein